MGLSCQSKQQSHTKPYAKQCLPGTYTAFWSPHCLGMRTAFSPRKASCPSERPAQNSLSFLWATLRCRPLLFFNSNSENSIWRELPDVVRWAERQAPGILLSPSQMLGRRHIPTCLVLYLAFSVGSQAQLLLFAQQASSDCTMFPAAFLLLLFWGFWQESTGHQDALFTYQPHHLYAL